MKHFSLQRQLYQQTRKTPDNNGLDLFYHQIYVRRRKKRKSCQLDIGLDLTMDNLTFGSMAYETIWMWCTRTVGQKSWWHSRLFKEAAMYQLTTLILLTTSKEGIPSQLVKRRMDDLEQIGFSWDIITSDETMQFINQNPNIQEQQRLSLHCHKSRRQ